MKAKLGERNKFFYDEKLKRWVEEGVEPQPEEAYLPPPPTTVAHQNGISVNDTNSAFKSPTHNANGILETSYLSPLQHASGIPPISPGPNQFSARNRMGVRSRWVSHFYYKELYTVNCGKNYVNLVSFLDTSTHSTRMEGSSQIHSGHPLLHLLSQQLVPHFLLLARLQLVMLQQEKAL